MKHVCVPPLACGYRLSNVHVANRVVGGFLTTVFEETNEGAGISGEGSEARRLYALNRIARVTRDDGSEAKNVR